MKTLQSKVKIVSKELIKGSNLLNTELIQVQNLFQSQVNFKV